MLGDRDEHRDDHGHVADLERRGVTVVRGRGEVTGPGRMVVHHDDGGRTELGWTDLVLATGASVALPPVEGLDDVDWWDSDDLWTADDLPSSLLVLGGGAVGLEAATAVSAFGTDVTVDDFKTMSNYGLIVVSSHGDNWYGGIRGMPSGKRVTAEVTHEEGYA